VFSGLQLEVSDALNHAGKGFGEGRVDEGKVGGNAEEIGGDDACRDDDGLGVGPIEEEQIVAEVGLPPPAGSASAARCRVGGHDTIASPPFPHGWMDFGDHTRELMPEDAGWSQHAGMIAAPEHLEVGAACQGGSDADADLALGEDRFGQVFDSDILLPAEYGGAHN
jgi:hypothetical protein